jgi:hypothetical protein
MNTASLLTIPNKVNKKQTKRIMIIESRTQRNKTRLNYQSQMNRMDSSKICIKIRIINRKLLSKLTSVNKMMLLIKKNGKFLFKSNFIIPHQ